MRYILLLILTGCSTGQPFDVSEIDGKTYTFKIHLVDRLPESRIGLHSYNPITKDHTIILIKDQFPVCLSHEVLHVMVGNWHKGRDSDKYCYSR